MRFQALEEAENHVNSRSKYNFKLPHLAHIASFGNPSRAKIHTQLEHNFFKAENHDHSRLKYDFKLPHHAKITFLATPRAPKYTPSSNITPVSTLAALGLRFWPPLARQNTHPART